MPDLGIRKGFCMKFNKTKFSQIFQAQPCPEIKIKSFLIFGNSPL